jgi:hypothetical protein
MRKRLAMAEGSPWPRKSGRVTACSRTAAIPGTSIAPSSEHAAASTQVRSQGAPRTQSPVGKNPSIRDTASNPPEPNRAPRGLRSERSCSLGASARQVRDPHRARHGSHRGRLEPARRLQHGLSHQAYRQRSPLRARRGARTRRRDRVRASSGFHHEGDGAHRRTRGDAHPCSHPPLAPEATRPEVAPRISARGGKFHRTPRRAGAREPAARGSSASRTARCVDRYLAARSQ